MTEALKLMAESLVEMLEDELRRISDLSNSEVAKISGVTRAFVGSNVDKALYNELMRSITDENSEFSLNPKLACLKFSLCVCLQADAERIRSFMNGADAPAITESQIVQLTALYSELVATDYSDAELFSTVPSDDERLLALREDINRHVWSALFSVNEKVRQCYEKANATMLKIKHQMSDREDELEKVVLPEMEKVREQISILKEAIENDSIVNMERITYPDRSATYTCGNCESVHSATGMFYTRVYPASSADYDRATLCLLDRAKPTLTDQNILHDSCIFAPEKCPKCGYVNIPGQNFLNYYKYGVLRMWKEMPPADFCKGAKVQFGCGVIPVEATDISPRVEIQTEEPKPLVAKYTDIYSRETYDRYLQGLHLKAKCKTLQSGATRNIGFITYLIHSFHTRTIGYTQLDYLYTIVKRYFSPDFIQRVNGYYKDLVALEELRIIYRVVSNENLGKPFAGYSDVPLSTDYISELLAWNTDLQAVKRLRNNDYSAEVLSDLREDIQIISNRCREFEDNVGGLCRQVASNLERDCCRLSKGVGAVISEDLFGISKATESVGHLVDSGIADIMWTAFSKYYLQCLINTVVVNRELLYNTALLRGLFRKDSYKQMRPIARTIYCAALQKPRLPQSMVLDSKDDCLCFVLNSCLNAVDATALSLAINVNKNNLVKIKWEVLPSYEDCLKIIKYKALDKSQWDNLSCFAEAQSIDSFRLSLETIGGDPEEIKQWDSYTEAEIAAAFYIICTPFEDTIPSIRSELRAIKSNSQFEQADKLHLA